jgi:hypothetical protein
MVAKSQYNLDKDKSSYLHVKRDASRIERNKTGVPKKREAATGNESDG